MKIVKFDITDQKFKLGEIQQGETNEYLNDELCTAGESIIRGRFVERGTDGKVYHAQLTQAHAGRAIGMALQSANIDGTLNVRHSGKVVESTWTLSEGANYFLNTNGSMTTVPPSSEFIQLLGTSSNSTTFDINIQLPIIIG